MPQVTLDRTSAAEFTLTVELAPDDYQSRASAELKKLARTAKIKGFRPGKVPAGYMKKAYGKGVVMDAISKSLDAAIEDAVKKEELEIFGQLNSVEEPDLSHLSADLDDTLTFKFEGGLVPKVEDVDTDVLKSVSRYTVQLTDEEADAKIDDARKRHMDYLERDVVETEDDFATLVVSDPELDAKYYGDAGSAHSAEPTVGNDAKDEADAESAEHQHGGSDGDDAEELEVEVEDDEAEDNRVADKPRDPRPRQFLRASEMIEMSRYKLVDKGRGTELILALADLQEEARERFAKVITEDGTTTFTLAKVDRELLPEHGEGLYQKIFGESTSVKTQDEARAEFKKMFGDNSQDNLDDFTLEQIIDALDGANPIDTPRAAIKTRLELARNEELAAAKKENRAPEYDHDLTEADRHGLARRLKWMAIRKVLVDTHNIDLTKEDMDGAIEREYRKQLGGMGLDPEQFRAQFFDTFRKNLFENRERMMEMTDEMLTGALLVKLEEEGVLGERQYVSETDFSNTVEAYNKRVSEQLEGLRAQPLA